MFEKEVLGFADRYISTAASHYIEEDRKMLK